MTDTSNSPEMRILTRTSPELAQAQALYESAFPKYERKPFEMILSGQEDGKMIPYSVFMDGRYAALAFLIPGKTVDVLDYLAVEPSMRNEEIGSKILWWLKRHRWNPILVEIESTLQKDADPMNLRRKKFYLSNGFYDCREEIELFGTDMELLSTRHPVAFEEYYATMKSYFGDSKAQHWVRRKPQRKKGRKTRKT